VGGGNGPLLGKFNQIGIKINFMEILFPVAEGEFFYFAQAEGRVAEESAAEGSVAKESAAVPFSARLDALDKQQSAKKILILRRG
jgi:hypothetical protein